MADLTEDEMRLAPLTLADMNDASSSAHAFWKRELRDEHTSGVDAVAFSNGTVEIHCRECKRLLGVLALARAKEESERRAREGNKP